MQRAFTSALPFQEAIEKNAQATRQNYLRHLVEAAKARGELSNDLEPAIAVFVIETVFANLGHYVRKTFELDVSKTESLKDLALEHVFDQVLMVLRKGLAGAAA